MAAARQSWPPPPNRRHPDTRLSLACTAAGSLDPPTRGQAQGGCQDAGLAGGDGAAGGPPATTTISPVVTTGRSQCALKGGLDGDRVVLAALLHRLAVKDDVDGRGKALFYDDGLDAKLLTRQEGRGRGRRIRRRRRQSGRLRAAPAGAAAVLPNHRGFVAGAQVGQLAQAAGAADGARAAARRGRVAAAATAQGGGGDGGGGTAGGGDDGGIMLPQVQSATLYTSEQPPVVESQ